MKNLRTLLALALVLIGGLALLSCKRQSSSDNQRSMTLLDQDPRSAKDSPAVVLADSSVFAKGERPLLAEPPPWLSPADALPKGMEIDAVAPSERLDYSKGVPVPVEPQNASPPK